MIFEVEMHAFAHGVIREVDVPTEEMNKHLPLSPAHDGVLTENKAAILDLIFHYGQNDFQPRALPSVSVGDIIRFGVVYKNRLNEGVFQERWAILAIGFRKVDKDFVPPHNGGIWAYSL